MFISYCSAGTISKEQGAVLMDKIKSGDKEIIDTFAIYEADHDVYKLIGTLRGMATAKTASPARTSPTKSSPTRSSPARAAGEHAHVHFSPDVKSPNSSPSKASPAKPTVDQASIEKKFLTIVQTMSLSSVETAALRLAIARGDAHIRDALEIFKLEQDEDRLVETLRTIAKATISATMEEQDRKEAAGEESDDDDDDDDDSDADSGDDDSDEEDEVRNNTQANANTGSPEATSAGSSALSTQTARTQIFPILLNELSKENIVRKDQAETLFSLFQENNVVIAAALDVYDLDNDMAELVDTLHRIANSYA